MFFCYCNDSFFELLIDAVFINDNTVDIYRIQKKDDIQLHLSDDVEEQCYFRKNIETTNRYSYIFKVKNNSWFSINHASLFMENMKRHLFQLGLQSNVTMLFFVIFFTLFILKY